MLGIVYSSDESLSDSSSENVSSCDNEIDDTEGEFYTALGLFLLMVIVQKPTARSYFSRRRVISTPGFADVISRERFELICKFLHFIDNESLPTYQGLIVQNLSCDMSFEHKFSNSVSSKPKHCHC